MYLVSVSPFPFKAEEVRSAIGLKSTAFDLLIDGAIASLCIMSKRPVRSETWAVRDDKDFLETSSRYGTPVTIGEPRRVSERDPSLYRDCTYSAGPEAIVAVRQRIVNWCLNQDDITLALATEQWPNPVTDAGKLGLIEALQAVS